jgi:Domain of unknown function (DUF1942)
VKIDKIAGILLAGSAAAAAGAILGVPLAGADDTTTATTTTMGQQAKLINGSVVQGWTVTGLKPSSDVIPYSARGTLWEATATNEAIQGSATPIVSNLNARSAGGDNYRVLYGVATPQGVNPSTITQGQKTTGKVYFDVTGDSPDTVVFNSAGDDLLVWEPAPVVQSSPQWTPPSSGTVQRAPAAATPAPAATGSQGTPLPAGTTPAPAATAPAPAATGSQGTPLPAGATPAPAATAPAAPAASAGSAGTPLPADGSSGTPVLESVPTTTGVPHGPRS